jgi:hypothetical protein
VKGVFAQIDQPILVIGLAGVVSISSCTLRVKNFGRTPAKVTEQKVYLIVGQDTEMIPGAEAYEPKNATPES